MSDPAVKRQLSHLGKGLLQVNLRLSRLLELAESTKGRDPLPTGDLLLDLVEAVERTLEGPQPTWWQRVTGRATVDTRGLSVALAQVADALAAHGITPAPREGPIDPALHRVIDTRPAAEAAKHGRIAATHRRGWRKAEGVPLRVAQVTAWRHEDSDD